MKKQISNLIIMFSIFITIFLSNDRLLLDHFICVTTGYLIGNISSKLYFIDPVATIISISSFIIGKYL